MCISHCLGHLQGVTLTRARGAPPWKKLCHPGQCVELGPDPPNIILPFWYMEFASQMKQEQSLSALFLFVMKTRLGVGVGGGGWCESTFWVQQKWAPSICSPPQKFFFFFLNGATVKITACIYDTRSLLSKQAPVIKYMVVTTFIYLFISVPLVVKIWEDIVPPRPNIWRYSPEIKGLAAARIAFSDQNTVLGVSNSLHTVHARVQKSVHTF